MLGLTVVADASSQWRPSGALLAIPVTENCAITGGDIAVALPIGPRGTIYYCQAVANRANALDPGSGHFYYVHEFGHLAIPTSNEWDADCWATQQLQSVSGGQFIDAMLSHLRRRARSGEPGHPRYGTPLQRASNIESCMGRRASERSRATETLPPIRSWAPATMIQGSKGLDGEREEPVLEDRDMLALSAMDRNLWVVEQEITWSPDWQVPYVSYRYLLSNNFRSMTRCVIEVQSVIVSRADPDRVVSKFVAQRFVRLVEPGRDRVIRGMLTWQGQRPENTMPSLFITSAC